MKILVSLSCTMCPELVTAAQRIAAENPFVTAEVYDLNHFPALKDQYKVMSVPCLVINDGGKSYIWKEECESAVGTDKQSVILIQKYIVCWRGLRTGRCGCRLSGLILQSSVPLNMSEEKRGVER